MSTETRKKSHYSTYHVMEHQEFWDPHTQEIVKGRIEFNYTAKALSTLQMEKLKKICRLLVDDNNDEVMEYVLQHIDHTLASECPEAQREDGIPTIKTLLLDGLDHLDAISQQYNYLEFLQSNEASQHATLQEVSNGTGPLQEQWPAKVRKAFFKKLLSLTVDAYYSHPNIWSEIGYGGPAYPRGYYRTNKGQLDPWEPKPDIIIPKS
ncbi:hypothetical protein BHU72_10125 [Desulfuribacillus stibiiarsenatis]|uniref:Gluconate 2-dehydrogenase n=1 Tax=Desulfuribacillus stibiiarsenatis TaxID=1390249 RepID=A0A1E5L907_9FIRM|nr:gluconate 2-dehydrogenase subunit 3 family protein [Desulfuribacillus stibiiarsenatis]OEH86606.1 hypothetical protein BHU72_10125 [Desulfuribacillus stibiiarsenatis]